MTVAWTAHRFSGGVLALDVANTVVHRDRPEKRFDRFDDPREIARFAYAAGAFRAAEFGGRALGAADPVAVKPKVVALREAIDALFRDGAVSGSLRSGLLERFLRATADGLGGHDEILARAPLAFAPETRPLAFEAALAVSALSLLGDASWRRIRICPNCAWLFADRSRNGSRTWCDMAVCGNRQKARRHYRRRRDEEERPHA